MPIISGAPKLKREPAPGFYPRSAKSLPPRKWAIWIAPGVGSLTGGVRDAVVVLPSMRRAVYDAVHHSAVPKVRALLEST